MNNNYGYVPPQTGVPVQNYPQPGAQGVIPPQSGIILPPNQAMAGPQSDFFQRPGAQGINPSQMGIPQQPVASNPPSTMFGVVSQPGLPFGPIPVPSYKPLTYKISKESIKNCNALFAKYDVNQNGMLNYNEFMPFFTEILVQNHQPVPNPADVAFYIHKYGRSANNQLTLYETKRLLRELAGHKKYTPDSFSKQPKTRHHRNLF